MLESRPGHRLAPMALAMISLGVSALDARAQTAEDIAKALQDPLANISAIMTDNAVNFNSGQPEKTGYTFQIQPVYSIPMEQINLILRGVIPIVGAPPSADFPNLGPPQPPGDATEWGLSDIFLQSFVNPKSDGAWKWGVGPQLSLKTQASAGVAGPGWGAGVGGVVVGGFGDNLSVAVLVSQHWGFEGDFSSSTVQPIVTYNLPDAWAISYNNGIVANWKATAANAWTVPLGAGISKSFVVGRGHGIALDLAYYGMVVTPDGGPNSQMKFAISWLIPR